MFLTTLVLTLWGFKAAPWNLHNNLRKPVIAYKGAGDARAGVPNLCARTCRKAHPVALLCDATLCLHFETLISHSLVCCSVSASGVCHCRH